MTYDPRRGSSTYLGMDDGGPEEGMPQFSTPTLERGDDGVRPVTRVDGRSAQASSARAAAKDLPPTVRRASQAPRRAVAPVTPDMGRRQVPRPVPSPRQQPYRPAASVPSARRAAEGRFALWLKAFGIHLVALAFRLVALVMAALVVASAFLAGSARASLVSALNLTPLLVPASLLGRFVAETPFGGVFRGDLAFASIILFCADWLCMEFSTSLRQRRERGA